MHTDASSHGLGSVLLQKQDGKERVIAYASRSLRPSERNYPAHKLEFLALKWSVTDKFHDYLYGNDFVVKTDNNPLTYVTTSAKLDATQHRWLADLANYNFTMEYRSGQHNMDADDLSRRHIFQDELKAIYHAVVSSAPIFNSTSGAAAPQMATDEADVTDSLAKIDWVQEQSNDNILSQVKNILCSGSLPRGRNTSESPAVQKYFREANKLFLHNNILYRSATLDGQQVRQLVIPESHRNIAMKGIHNDAGHQGKDKTLWLGRQRFYWPGMEKDIHSWVERCDRCIRRKTPCNKPFAELKPIHTTRPMELVSIDFLKLEPSKGGIENILVIVDHFTRFAQAIPCRNQTAITTAKALYEGYFRYYGFPEQLHSDQGRNFLSHTIQELCKIAGIKKSRTTPYHAMGNGGAERWNQTLLKMLGTLENHHKSDWKAYIAPLVQAYNATKNDSTGYAPHFLMFGWHPRLPVDAYLGTDPSEEHTGNQSSYASKLHKRLQIAYRRAAEEAGKMATKNKNIYDQKVRYTRLDIGDKVLIRKVGMKGTNKLSDRWDEEIYVVLSRPNPDIPVYRVQHHDKKGPIKTLHRNMLLPYSVDLSLEPRTESSTRKRTPSKFSSTDQSNTPSSETNNTSDSESDNDADRTNIYYPPQVKQIKQKQSPHMYSNETGLTSSNISEPSQVLELSQIDPSAEVITIPDHQSSESLLPQSESETATVSVEQDPSCTPTPVPQPSSPRPVRQRAPPQRYGEWVYSPIVVEDFEVFV